MWTGNEIMAKLKYVVGVSLISILIGFANLTAANRDGVATIGVSSFNHFEIVSNRLWTEAPMQVLHTFAGSNSSILFVGQPGNGGLHFVDRLKFRFGPDQVDSTNPPADLREILGADEIGFLKSFVQTLSYRSFQPCPHDAARDCVIAVGWNRELSSRVGMRWIATRISEDTYLIIDDSILSVE